MKPHKHAELIKAWADGAEIQRWSPNGWFEMSSPDWDYLCDYRIKPEPRNDNFQTYSIQQPPELVGWWQITPDVGGGWYTRFAVYETPEPRHIENIERMFGWKWIDGKAQEK